MEKTANEYKTKKCWSSNNKVGVQGFTNVRTIAKIASARTKRTHVRPVSCSCCSRDQINNIFDVFIQRFVIIRSDYWVASNSTQLLFIRRKLSIHDSQRKLSVFDFVGREQKRSKGASHIDLVFSCLLQRNASTFRIVGIRYVRMARKTHLWKLPSKLHSGRFKVSNTVWASYMNSEPLPAARCYASTCVYTNQLYVIGGCDERGEPMDTGRLLILDGIGKITSVFEPKKSLMLRW